MIIGENKVNVKGKIATAAYLWKCTMCSSVNNRDTVASNDICGRLMHMTFCARSAYFYIRLEFRIICRRKLQKLIPIIPCNIARKRGGKKEKRCV